MNNNIYTSSHKFYSLIEVHLISLHVWLVTFLIRVLSNEMKQTEITIKLDEKIQQIGKRENGFRLYNGMSGLAMVLVRQS